MSAQHEAVVVTLTGQLAMMLVLAVPLAFLLSWLLLRIYLRAVKRSMVRHSGAAAPEVAEEGPAAGAAPPVLEIVEVRAGHSPAGDALARGALSARCRQPPFMRSPAGLARACWPRSISAPTDWSSSRAASPSWPVAMPDRWC